MCWSSPARPSLGPLVLLLSLLLILSTPGMAAPSDEPRTVDLRKITLDLPPVLDGLEAREKRHAGSAPLWSGLVGQATVEMLVNIRPRPYEMWPEDVTAQLARRFRPANTEDRKARYSYATRKLIEGRLGIYPYASLCTGPAPKRPPVPSRRKVTGEVFVLGGVLENDTYTVELYTGPELEPDAREAILEFLEKGVRSKVEPHDGTWTSEEMKQRWIDAVPDEKVQDQLAPPIVTKHYVILTNSSAGKVFARTMESSYKQIQKVFPFPEVKGRKLMPVFLFRMREEYIQFTMHSTGWDREAAERTGGHATMDYYATYYQSPKDPVHIHEATHQIFQNRIRLSGGGSWFQEGVAEYVSSSKNQRKSFAKRVAKNGKYIPFRQFVQIPSIINNGFLGAGGSYTQAATLIHFLRDGKWHPEKFDQFLLEIGSIERNDVTRIEETLQRIYGVGLAGLEEEWVKYWKRQ